MCAHTGTHPSHSPQAGVLHAHTRAHAHPGPSPQAGVLFPQLPQLPLHRRQPHQLRPHVLHDRCVLLLQGQLLLQILIEVGDREEGDGQTPRAPRPLTASGAPARGAGARHRQHEETLRSLRGETPARPRALPAGPVCSVMTESLHSEAFPSYMESPGTHGDASETPGQVTGQVKNTDPGLNQAVVQPTLRGQTLGQAVRAVAQRRQGPCRERQLSGRAVLGATEGWADGAGSSVDREGRQTGTVATEAST